MVCNGALILTLCKLPISQYRSIVATFPVPVLIARLPSARVIPPLDPLPPTTIAVEVVDVRYPDRSGGVYENTPVLLLYDNADVPTGLVVVERSFNDIPLSDGF